jgi:signal transduction histidine kinase
MMKTGLRIAILPAAVALGLFAEWTVLHREPLEPALSGEAIRLAAGDFVVGLALVACGVVAWLRLAESRVGPLLIVSGFAWFLGTFAGSSIDSAAGFGAIFVTLHRGPLTHAILSYPTGRLVGRFERVVVLVSYVAAAIPDVGQKPETMIALGVLIPATAARSYGRSSGPWRRARGLAVVTASAFGAVLLVAGVAVLANESPNVERAILWAYEAVIFGIALTFAAGLVRARWTDATVTGLVVELGSVPERGTLRERLAAALGDPSLAVGYWLAEEQAYFDETGRKLALPAVGSGREATIVREGEDPVAALVHDAGVVEDRRLVESVAAAARIAVANVRLQAEIRRQVDEIEASRRRIVEAADRERRRLSQALRQGAEQRLAHVEAILAESEPGNEPAALHAEAISEVACAREELTEFARGVHPRILTEEGLAAALADLARRAPVPVSLEAPAERGPTPVEAAAYFVCSEALANVGKYAQASRASIDAVLHDGRLTVAVRDDGVGGASLAGGSGLRGLADRVEALGGTLRLESSPGQGTLVLAELPLG